MKILRWIILIISLTVTLSGCSEKEWFPLTKVEKQMIPYKMGDTIRFIDEKGEQALCGVDRDIIYRDRFTDGYFISISEVREVRLVWERGGLSFVLTVGRCRWVRDNILEIYTKINHADFGFLDIPYNSKGNIGNYDSLEINNHTYYDVAVVESRGVQLYYNKTFGILQVTQDGKDIFTLVP